MLPSTKEQLGRVKELLPTLQVLSRSSMTVLKSKTASRGFGLSNGSDL